MNRAYAAAGFVVVAFAVRADAIGCKEGATRVCRVNGKSGTQECENGRWTPCLPDTPPPSPPPAGSPAAAPAQDVTVEVRPEQVDQRTAFTDCCASCGEQTLEAVTPTPNGPRAHLDTEPPPLRQTFCGRVTEYSVNNEVADPRDITMNLVPLPIPPFPDFVAGLVNTTATQIPPNSPDLMAPPSFSCDVDACAARAARVAGKTIHAEVTPDEHFYRQDRRFLPIDSHGACSDSPEACTSELERPAEVPVCVHGVYAYDHGGHRAGTHRPLCCVFLNPGHDHPEIHPFDAIWWKDPRKNGWMFGVFQDDSNRYSDPHCSSDNNGAKWSQAPRDVTFRFPFRFKRSAGCQQVVLRHVRTLKMRTAAANTVKPVNVTTSDLVGRAPEALTFLAPGPQLRPLLEVRKEQGSGGETHVAVEGSVQGDDVVGDIALRVAVGTDRRTASPFSALRAANPLVTYDDTDPGAGYFYGELFFAGSCGPVVVR